MRSSQRFGVNRPPTTIINAFSAGGVKAIAISAAGIAHGAQILSGALTADVYKEIASAAGAGFIDICGAYSLDATARTVGLKVVFDGQPAAFDATTDATNDAYQGLLAVGVKSASTGGYTHPQRFYFNSSLSVQVKSNLNETDKVGLNVLFGAM